MKIEIDLDQLKKDIAQEVVNRLKPLLLNKDKGKGGDTIFDVEGLARYLCVRRSWIYGNVKLLPHYRVGQRPKFKKSQIDAWLESQKAPQWIDPAKRIYNI